MGVRCRSPHGAEVGASVVSEAVSTVLSTVDLSSVLQRTATLLRRHFGETRVTITRCLRDAPGQAEVLLVDDPRETRALTGARFSLEGSPSGEAVARREPFVLEPLDPARYPEESALSALGYGSLVCFPLLFEGRVLGTLEIAHPHEDGLLGCCLDTAGRVAHLVAIALNNSLLVEEVRRLNRLLDRENAQLREEVRQCRIERRYIAESPAMKRVVERVRLVAASDTTVLLRGETGTGKEGLARMVHDCSPRFAGPFVVVNMGAIPDALIESELFGHEKGSFTGALRRKAGRFEQAEGGTIFLDEVGDAPLSVQVRLLRVLQEREVQRVGGDAAIPVNVRVVAATNRPLEAMVSEGRFREDLYYRLAVFPVEVPPLRARKGDIRPLVECFLERHAAAMNRRAPAASEAVLRAFEACDWPGNVRELENAVQRELILSPGPELRLPDLACVPSALPLDAPPEETLEGPAPGPFDDEVKGLLRRALAATQGRIYGPTGAAALLALPPTTLQGKLRRYGLEPGRAR